MDDEKSTELKTKFKAKTMWIIADIASQELGIPKKTIKEDTEIPNNAAGFMVAKRMAHAVLGKGGEVPVTQIAGRKYLCTAGELAELYVNEAFKKHEMETK